MSLQEKTKYLTKVFGRSKMQNNGIELMVPCPFCKKPKKLKMNIRLDSDLYHCWVCNAKGRNLGRLIKQKNPSLVAEYHSKFGKKFSSNIEIDVKEIPVVLPDQFKLLMQNKNDPDARAIISYCRSRGINDKLMWRYRLGYSDEWKWRRRLIIPSFDCEGNLNYFVTRTIDDSNFKYVNAQANKRAIIFNDIDINWAEKTIFIVEGPFDWMKCCNLNALCILGSSLTEDSKAFRKIVANSMDVILSLDPDADIKQLKIAELFSQYDINVRLASVKSGDVGDLQPQDVAMLAKTAVEYNNDMGSLPFLIQRM